MTPRERADRAKHLLEDPVFVAALQDIRQKFVEKLEMCPIGDIDTQHEIALSLQLLKQIPAQFKKYAEELVVEDHKKKHDGFIQKMTQRYRA